MFSKVLLESRWVERRVDLNDQLGLAANPVIYLLAWSVLLRVQSEALPCQRGSEADFVQLPAGRHSGLWVSGLGVAAGAIHLRLMTRKHRRQGSLLSRQCSCVSWSPAYCIVHRAARWLEDYAVAAGGALWDLTPSAFVRTLRAQLAIVGHPLAKQASPKAFRAGRATEMAARCSPLGEILLAGEWRSRAFLSYVDIDAIDVPAVLGAALEDDNDED